MAQVLARTGFGAVRSSGSVGRTAYVMSTRTVDHSDARRIRGGAWHSQCETRLKAGGRVPAFERQQREAEPAPSKTAGIFLGAGPGARTSEILNLSAIAGTVEDVPVQTSTKGTEGSTSSSNTCLAA